MGIKVFYTFQFPFILMYIHQAKGSLESSLQRSSTCKGQTYPRDAEFPGKLRHAVIVETIKAFIAL